ncbi:uncharacterized protein LOC113208550 [Frankliniella occidentalis]|uniref:Uncharacterized protein LOC113208550 n=1 Tax=Frankliniella occidentalis TaxID=133901 RepID=A0A9C6X955_FRAOC|nr:uncharacterized protein LOC113208550 [Frankliniella occidentalis]
MPPSSRGSRKEMTTTPVKISVELTETEKEVIWFLASGEGKCPVREWDEMTKAWNECEKQPTPPLLPDLPDLALLRMLSFLPFKDLLAAVQAVPRLGELTSTRTHRDRPFWNGDGDVSVHVKDAEGFLALLQIAPVHTLQTNSGTDGDVSGRFRSPSRLTLTLDTSPARARGPRNAQRARLLRKLIGPQVKHLDLSEPDLGWLFDGLRNARCLETLHVWHWQLERGTTVLWPQEAAPLPKLHSVRVSILYGAYFDLEMKRGMKAFSSLLRAHSEQLRCVTLSTKQLMPLLDDCSDNLRRLDVVADVGLAAKLRPLSGLKELRIEMPPTPEDALYEEVEDLLRSWPGRLDRLELVGLRDDPLEAVLDAGELTDSLEHLVVQAPSQFNGLLREDAVFERLRSLVLFVLRGTPPLDVLEDICATAMPALELLVVASYFPKSNHCYDYLLKAKATEEYADMAGEVVPVLDDLVMRAGYQSLHVVLRLVCDCDRDPVCCGLLFAHPLAEADGCALCAEATEAAALRCCFYTGSSWSASEVVRRQVT